MAVFGSSTALPDTAEWIEAATVGARCAEAGLTVITGGYGGVMEAASKGAAERGGRVIGVTAPTLFPARPGANPFVSEEIPAANLAERIGILTDMANGAVVMPGSIGTATELVVSWNLNHISRWGGGQRLPTVAVGDGWRALWNLLSREMNAFHDDILVVDSGSEAIEWLLTQPEIR